MRYQLMIKLAKVSQLCILMILIRTGPDCFNQVQAQDQSRPEKSKAQNMPIELAPSAPAFKSNTAQRQVPELPQLAYQLGMAIEDLNHVDPQIQDKAIDRLNDIARHIAETKNQTSQLGFKTLKAGGQLNAAHLLFSAYYALAASAEKSQSTAELNYHIKRIRALAIDAKQWRHPEAARLAIFWHLQVDLFELKAAHLQRTAYLKQAAHKMKMSLNKLKKHDNQQKHTLTQSMTMDLQLSLLAIFDELGDMKALGDLLKTAPQVESPKQQAYLDELRHYQGLIGKKVIFNIALTNQDGEVASFKNQVAPGKGNFSDRSQKSDSKLKTLLYFCEPQLQQTAETIASFERMRQRLLMLDIQFIPVFVNQVPIPQLAVAKKSKKKPETERMKHATTRTTKRQIKAKKSHMRDQDTKKAQNQPRDSAQTSAADTGFYCYQENTAKIKLSQLLGIQSNPRFVFLDQQGVVLKVSGPQAGFNILDR